MWRCTALVPSITIKVNYWWWRYQDIGTSGRCLIGSYATCDFFTQRKRSHSPCLHTYPGSLSQHLLRRCTNIPRHYSNHTSRRSTKRWPQEARRLLVLCLASRFLPCKRACWQSEPFISISQSYHDLILFTHSVNSRHIAKEILCLPSCPILERAENS